MHKNCRFKMRFVALKAQCFKIDKNMNSLTKCKKKYYNIIKSRKLTFLHLKKIRDNVNSWSICSK